MLSKRASLYIILILIVIFLSILLGTIQVNQMKDIQKDTLLMQGSKIHVTKLDTNGKIKYEIYADSFKDISNTKTIIHNPRATFYSKEEQPPWNVKSKTGFLYNQHFRKNEYLLLQSGVYLERKASTSTIKKIKPLEIKTDKVNIFVNNNIVYTPSFVTISEPKTTNKTTANGLIYSSANKKLFLLDNIKTHYQPTKNI